MPKKPLNPSKNGVKSIIFKLVLVVSCLLLLPDTTPAASSQPIHRLHIRFDIARSIMYGTSTVDIPANSGAIYHTPGLTINALSINGQSIEPGDHSQPYFADPDHSLTIAPNPSPTTVEMNYELDLSNRNSSLSDLISAEGISLTGIWHPFLHQDQIFKLTAEIPKNFEAISEAEVIASSEDAAAKTVTFSFNYPLAGINFIAGPFLIEKTSFGDNRELYTYFFAEDQDLVADYRQKTLEYLARYEEMIGPFPYKRFSVVENRLPTGYAMPTFTVLGQSVVRLPFITETSLGHETLHQWFASSVRIDPASGNWSEGLTTFLADALYQSEQGQGSEFRKNRLIRYHSYVHPDNTLSLQNFAGTQSHLIRGQEDLRAIGYTKSAMLFQMLRDKIGPEKFTAGLRDIYHRYKHQKIGWQNIRSSFEQVAGLNLYDFFEQWLTRPDLPAVNISNFRMEEEDGRPVMRFNLVEANQGDHFQLTMPVTVITDNDTVRRNIELTGKETAVEIPLTATPRELILDENYEIMRRLAQSEIPPVWSGFVGAKEKLAVIDPDQDQSMFAPILAYLQNIGCRFITVADVTNNDIASSATIFLGITSPISKRMFAQPDHPATGMTVDIRANPFNPALTAVLISAANAEEVNLAARKITHYSKYSYLHFELGKIVRKEISPTKNGQRFTVSTPPGGIKIETNLSFDGIVDKLQDQQVVYIGESHTRYEDHLLQLRIIRAMYHQNPNLSIGMEMFDRSTQQILDNYVLDQTINEEDFLLQSHYFSKWSYDYRFYQPIINFARLNRIPILALNQDKDLVSKVYKESGLKGLSDQEILAIPEDLDISMPNYRQRLSSVFSMHNGHDNKQEQLNKFLQAQSVWDETMAESIASYLTDNPTRRMAVIAGRGHVNKENAIPPRVARRLAVKQAVVLNVEQLEVAATNADYLFFSTPASLPPAAMMGVILMEKENRIVIEKLSPHGMAGTAGIKKGDIILALDGKPITRIEELKTILFFKKKGAKVTASIKRINKLWPDSELEIEVPL